VVHDCGDPVFSDETFVMQLPETETDIEECVLRVEVRDALTALVTHHRGGARCGWRCETLSLSFLLSLLLVLRLVPAPLPLMLPLLPRFAFGVGRFTTRTTPTRTTLWARCVTVQLDALL
jgi:hypothetical protein